MKRNLDAPILQLDGSEFSDKATLGTVCFSAVVAVIPADQNSDITQKIALYNLAQILAKGGEVDLTSEDIVLLKDRVGKVISNVIAIGRVFELLEPK